MLRRPRVTGFRRVLVEVSGDGLTLLSFAAVIVLTLALPAMEATRVDWRAQGEYAVTFVDASGAEIGRRGIRHVDSVPLDEMPDYLVAAVLSTEDRRFYGHFGVDVFGTARALLENARANTIVQGGSSITQQVARILYLTTDRTLSRKIQEAFIAVWLEATLSKDEILKLYLDRGYLGGGNFGVAAAADFYFDKPVQEVTLAEAAMLAGLFQSPSRYAPHVNLPAARARANEVLTNLVETGYLTEGQVIGARRRPAEVARSATEAETPDYFLDWAFAEVQRLVPSGDRILTVRTTLDSALQHTGEEAIVATLRESGGTYAVTQGALVVMSPTGAVQTMVGGRDYGESQFNRATLALRQPGSAFKPFVYATAMMNGYTPESVVPDAPITIGDWSPRNFSGGYAGPVTLTTAFVRSINTVPVRLGQAIGRDLIAETAHDMGIETDIAVTRSLPLGSSEVTVLEMAAGYAAFANGGFRARPYTITEIVNSSGTVVYERDPPARERVLPPDAVAMMNGMMTLVPEIGTGRAAKIEGIPTAGKTGTTSSFRDAWFVGFTGNYVAAVWFGNDDYQPTNDLTGGTLPAQAWNRVMTAAHRGIEIRQIPFVERPEYDAIRLAAQEAAQIAATEAAIPPPPPPLAPAVQGRLEAIGRLFAADDADGPLAAR
ncbi:MAG: transglycosylase domain-containing protein [Bauldia sp.]